ncbi:scopoletin glucosyltransferase-like [Silene latifolia]|uniref:scopoletin glucosyltransferase-like n=1 Tax=Silene latifolia TaxID=37657 RepID=UPI003D784AC1
MGAEPHQLHVVLFPFQAHGHMIPALDIARLFAARNVKSTIITTPVNASTFTKAIETGRRVGNSYIDLEIFKFPAKEAGLPEGCENAEIAIKQEGLNQRFFLAVELLQEQLEQYLDRVRPDCLVADMFFPWATASSAKFNIPRLVFHGFSYFSICAQELIRAYEPFQNVSSDDETFSLPLIPHEIKLTRSQLSPELMGDKDHPMRKKMEMIKKSELESYGVIVNSFYELEPDYAEFCRKELGRKTWHVGPVSLCNRSIQEKAERGKEVSINESECLTWLDSKKPASVVYICFGSLVQFIAPQLHEIAVALESSGKNFIWVVRNGNNNGKNDEEWLPSGFEQRTEGRGLIIRGWAPQVLILEHEAIGAFVTHCGWNSILEGISAGVPMVTWPIFAEQFYNEKLVTDILKIGVSVGVKKWSRMPSVEDVIRREVIETVLREMTEGDVVEEMRQRAKQLKDKAWNAVAEGGSSYSDLSALINELRSYHTH